MEDEVKEPAVKYNYISPDEYLAAERLAAEKHEYYRGEVFAMSGATLKHNITIKNLNTVVLPFLKGKGCDMFGSDLRIHIPENTLYTYPDFSIICGKPELTDKEMDTITNPSVVIEILSKSTRDYDRGTKFNLYRSIKTLKEYILVDSTGVSVEIFTRQQDERWILSEYKNLLEYFTITTIDLKILLADVYEAVRFDE